MATQKLPKRGTGLKNGRAGARRYGNPRTEEERKKRHSSKGHKYKVLYKS